MVSFDLGATLVRNDGCYESGIIARQINIITPCVLPQGKAALCTREDRDAQRQQRVIRHFVFSRRNRSVLL